LYIKKFYRRKKVVTISISIITITIKTAILHFRMFDVIGRYAYGVMFKNFCTCKGFYTEKYKTKYKKLLRFETCL